MNSRTTELPPRSPTIIADSDDEATKDDGEIEIDSSEEFREPSPKRRRQAAAADALPAQQVEHAHHQYLDLNHHLQSKYDDIDTSRILLELRPHPDPFCRLCCEFDTGDHFMCSPTEHNIRECAVHNIHRHWEDVKLFLIKKEVELALLKAKEANMTDRQTASLVAAHQKSAEKQFLDFQKLITIEEQAKEEKKEKEKKAQDEREKKKQKEDREDAVAKQKFDFERQKQLDKIALVDKQLQLADADLRAKRALQKDKQDNDLNMLDVQYRLKNQAADKERSHELKIWEYKVDISNGETARARLKKDNDAADREKAEQRQRDHHFTPAASVRDHFSYGSGFPNPNQINETIAAARANLAFAPPYAPHASFAPAAPPPSAFGTEPVVPPSTPATAPSSLPPVFSAASSSSQATATVPDPVALMAQFQQMMAVLANNLSATQ